MYYYSTNRHSSPVDFKTATIAGQAPDNGLYYPEKIPLIAAWQTKPLQEYSKEDIAFRVMQPFVGSNIPDNILFDIVSETIDFEFPLVKVYDEVYSLELFHGPTLAFKDVGARFMSRCLAYFNEGNTKKITVLVATSGDTGGAVADGFSGVSGVEVIILYPQGKVSSVQELQLTTCGSNVHALAIAGTFDDCQAMVKKAFADEQLQQSFQLTSANSINVARWLPQQLYYFYALGQWSGNSAPVISVPSGNFGNICAGMIAQRSGLPIQHFIAACNANDTIPAYLASGFMPNKPAIPTISNAMDVAQPSNFVRMMEMYDNDLHWLRQQLSAVSVSDEVTKQTIAQTWQQHGYLTDPHGAVALYGLQAYLSQHHSKSGIFLETAHPVKFPETVQQVTGESISLPEAVAPLLSKEKRSTHMSASYDMFKSWMLER